MINSNRTTYFLLLLLWFGASRPAAQVPDASVLTRKAPEKFKAVFNTTKGAFIIEAYRNWSPLGVDRLYQLIASGYYSNTLLFRVEPDYVVQFGVAETDRLNRFWDPKKIPDEPVRQKNTRGTIAFARDLKDTRCAQLFVNMANNRKLDTTMRNGVKGFVPIARVVQGMIIISSFNAAYKKRPVMVQDSLYKYGNRYFERKFPGLDRIISARILP
jgi:peptidyl-prolyl cis-trans isomerase A (cyclophilin A)